MQLPIFLTSLTFSFGLAQFSYLLLLFIVFQVNPNYDSTFVFGNDFPALQPDAPDPSKWQNTGFYLI